MACEHVAGGSCAQPCPEWVTCPMTPQRVVSPDQSVPQQCKQSYTTTLTICNGYICCFPCLVNVGRSGTINRRQKKSNTAKQAHTLQWSHPSAMPCCPPALLLLQCTLDQSTVEAPPRHESTSKLDRTCPSLRTLNSQSLHQPIDKQAHIH